MLHFSFDMLICSTEVVLASNTYRKGCTRLNTNHPTSFRSNPLLSDSQPTAASWIRWIACGWKHERSSSSVRHSRSRLSDLRDSQSNANTIKVQCKESNRLLHIQALGKRYRSHRSEFDCQKLENPGACVLFRMVWMQRQVVRLK